MICLAFFCLIVAALVLWQMQNEELVPDRPGDIDPLAEDGCGDVLENEPASATGDDAPTNVTEIDLTKVPPIQPSNNQHNVVTV